MFFSLLKQEIRAYNELLEFIHTTCDDLHRALIGEIVVSEILEETQRTLLMHEIPRLWKVCHSFHLSTRFLPTIDRLLLINRSLFMIIL